MAALKNPYKRGSLVWVRYVKYPHEVAFVRDIEWPTSSASSNSNNEVRLHVKFLGSLTEMWVPASSVLGLFSGPDDEPHRKNKQRFPILWFNQPERHKWVNVMNSIQRGQLLKNRIVTVDHDFLTDPRTLKRNDVFPKRPAGRPKKEKREGKRGRAPKISQEYTPMMVPPMIPPLLKNKEEDKGETTEEDEPKSEPMEDDEKMEQSKNEPMEDGEKMEENESKDKKEDKKEKEDKDKGEDKEEETYVHERHDGDTTEDDEVEISLSTDRRTTSAVIQELRERNMLLPKLPEEEDQHEKQEEEKEQEEKPKRKRGRPRKEKGAEEKAAGTEEKSKEEMMDYRPHRKLVAWQKSMELVQDVYKAVAEFPKYEEYGLSSQMRRAAISIPSNIAEGAARRGSKEFRQFLSIAQGSISELDTQLESAHMMGYIDSETCADLTAKLTGISKMLFGLTKSVK